MLVDYQSLSESARVWVYPSSRKFYPKELEELDKKMFHFVSNWRKDDDDFRASFRLLYNRFIIFLAEENSGLTITDIDQKVLFVLQLQQDYEVELLDRMNVSFKQGEFTQYKDLKTFKGLIKNRSVNDKTIVFDNLIQTKYELENHWEVPITDSWYNRFL